MSSSAIPSRAADAARRVGAIALADLRERMRSPRFLALAAALVVGSWWLVPPATAGYMVLDVGGGHRGPYSSAWIGLLLGMVAATPWSLVGFFVVRGTLARDLETRVWQLLVATPMTRRGYLIAKWASHLVVLLLPVFGALVVGLAAQLVRGEDRHVHLFELVLPTLVIALPSLAMTAAFAVWLDLVPALRRTAGNVVWFFAWGVFMSAMTAAMVPPQTPPAWLQVVGDPAGVGTVLHTLERLDRPELGGTHIKTFVLGNSGHKGPPQIFPFDAWHPTASDVFGRFLWLAASLAAVAAAAPLLDRAAARTEATTAPADRPGRRLRWLSRVLGPLSRGRMGSLVSVELQFVLRRRRAWWWLAALVSWILQLVPDPHVNAMASVGAWMLVLDVLGGALLRDRVARTEPLVACAPGGARRLLWARAAGSTLLALVMIAPSLVKALATSPPQLTGLVVLALALVAWGMAAAAVFRNARAFELVVAIGAYLTLEGAPLLDPREWSTGNVAANAAGIVVALAIAVVVAGDGMAGRWRLGRA